MDQQLPKRVDGKALSNELLEALKSRVAKLKKKDIVPTLAVVQVGNQTDSTSYIRQKRLKARVIGAKVTVKQFPTSVFFQTLAETVHAFNADPKVHGVIIQRPLPPMLATSAFNTAIELEKDIDGFRPKSVFQAPIALAVMHLFRHIYELKNVTTHLKNKQIVIIGRGETAGKPIGELLSEKKIPYIQCHSQTTNLHEFTKEADIIISCVGKPNIITNNMIKEGVVLIGVGINHDEKGVVHGDYDEKEIESKASFYTPTPGGVGPLNVTYLMENLVTAAEKEKIN